MNRRNKHAADRGKGLDLLPSLPAPLPDGHHRLGDLRDHLLPLAHGEGIDKGAHRSGIEGGRAASDDQRMAFIPLFPSKRNASEFEHHQDVRVGKFILKGKPDDVESVKRPMRLQRTEGQPASEQFSLHVRPGSIATLAGHLRQIVEDRVEDLEPEMRHPDLISVREGKGEMETASLRIFSHGIDLAADIAAGFFNGDQEFAGDHCGRIGHVSLSLSGIPGIGRD
jgi:hypothetical protein